MDAVFNAVRDCYAEHFFEQRAVPREYAGKCISHGSFPMHEAIPSDGDGGNSPRYQRRISNSRDPGMKNEHADNIADNIDSVCNGGYIHRHIGSADTAAHRRAGVINRESRERIRGYAHILDARRHDIILNPAEKQVQKWAFKDENKNGYNNRADNRKHQ